MDLCSFGDKSRSELLVTAPKSLKSRQKWRRGGGGERRVWQLLKGGSLIRTGINKWTKNQTDGFSWQTTSFHLSPNQLWHQSWHCRKARRLKIFLRLLVLVTCPNWRRQNQSVKDKMLFRSPFFPQLSPPFCKFCLWAAYQMGLNLKGWNKPSGVPGKQKVFLPFFVV